MIDLFRKYNMIDVFGKKDESLRCGLAIRILSIVALLCTVISCISKFRISALISIIPTVLFVIYVFKYHKEQKATILIPITFVLLAVVFMFRSLCAFDVHEGRWFWEYRIYFDENKLLTVLREMAFISCIVACISAWRGFDKKIIIMVTMLVCLLYEVIQIAYNINSIANGKHFFMRNIISNEIVPIINIIGISALCVALFLFGWKNFIRPIALKNKKATTDNPEQALSFLKAKRKCKVITEEDYQIQRTEIVSKL